MVGFRIDHSAQMRWRNTFFRRARRCTVTTLKVSTHHSFGLVSIHAKNSQLANFAFAIHFFSEYVVAIEYVSQNTSHRAFTRSSVAVHSLQDHRCSQQCLLKESLF
jgi:hypothetical protein